MFASRNTLWRIHVIQVALVLASTLQSAVTISVQSQQKQNATPTAQSVVEDRKSEEILDDNLAQSTASSSYSSVVYHDPPKTRFLKSNQDEVAQGSESTTNFRLYHSNHQKKENNYLNTMNPILVHNLMKQQPQTFDSGSTNKVEQNNVNGYQNFHQQQSNHNYKARDEQKTEETVTKYLYPPKKYKSVEPGSQTIFNVGYSIGFGSGSVNEKPQPSRLNSASIGNEEVVTGKPKQPFQIRVEGKNSYWKQISPSVEMSQNINNEESSQQQSTSNIITRNHNLRISDLPPENRNTFDHEHAITSSNHFDISNAVEPLLTTQPLALPMTFPLPLQDAILLQQPQTARQLPAAPPPNIHNFPNDFRITSQPILENKKQSKQLDAKATGTGSYHQTAFLPTDNFNTGVANNIYNAQPDNFILPSMQQVFISVGKDGQMIPAYLIPVTPLNHLPTVPANLFQQEFLPQRHSPSRNGRFQEPSQAATEPQLDHKQFKPSQPLHEPQLQQQPRQIPNELFKQIPNIPRNLVSLRPPAPEKLLQTQNIPQSSFSYQLYEQDTRPKVKTLVQVRPIQLPVALRPARDLASEQSMLNTILSQELYRKNTPGTRVPVIPQTIYGVKNF